MSMPIESLKTHPSPSLKDPNLDRCSKRSNISPFLNGPFTALLNKLDQLPKDIVILHIGNDDFSSHYKPSDR